MAAAGVRQDLLPLMKVPDMDAAKARALFKAGVRDAQVGGWAPPAAAPLPPVTQLLLQWLLLSLASTPAAL